MYDSRGDTAGGSANFCRPAMLRKAVLIHFTDWIWAITNNIDTTVAISDNTYDRIIINDATENNFLSVGVMDDVTKNQSDHYLVYAFFNPEVP